MYSRPSNVRWLVFAILAFGSFNSFVLRANISIAAQTMIEELELSEIELGWVLAAFTAGYAIFQFPGGVFGDKTGPRSALTIIAVLSGAAGSVMNTGANLMGVANALLVPWFANAFGWTVAIASGAGFALLGAVLLLFVRADKPLPG